MNVILILMPAALALGGLGLVAFLWSLKTNQYDDLDGEAERILFERDPVSPAKAKNPADRS